MQHVRLIRCKWCEECVIHQPVAGGTKPILGHLIKLSLVKVLTQFVGVQSIQTGAAYEYRDT